VPPDGEGALVSARPAALPQELCGLDGLLFDLDGVVTRTAALHAEAWKRLFDEHLAAREARGKGSVSRFDMVGDYRAHVDGRAREDGVRGFLASRGVVLPEGDPEDGPDRETVRGLARRKNAYFRELLLTRGVERFASTIALAELARRAGLRTAVVTSSRNGAAVLAAAGLAGTFDLLVDGTDLARLGLEGKPAPHLFLEAARRLGVSPARAAVLEDARAGVAAARAGGFALVVGVDRAGQAEALRKAGAHRVVSDLAELFAREKESRSAEARRMDHLPSALTGGALGAMLDGHSPALFLDYDGTLTAIVDRPEDALLPRATRDALSALARLCPVAVVSGRALSDVKDLVGLEGIVYAGCHGFDIAGPGVIPPRHAEAERALPLLAEVAEALARRLRTIEGVRVENKTYAVAVHTRLVAPEREDEVRAAVAGHGARHPELRLTAGKKVIEVRPRVEWDKGRAVLWLMGALHLDRPEVVPVYVGDDLTDEDAFAALDGRGAGIVVGRDSRLTRARYALADPRDVLLFLEALHAGLAGVA
jgi:trehalose 6-phosphate phosphatase